MTRTILDENTLLVTTDEEKYVYKNNDKKNYGKNIENLENNFSK